MLSCAWKSTEVYNTDTDRSWLVRVRPETQTFTQRDLLLPIYVSQIPFLLQGKALGGLPQWQAAEFF